jgi:alpha-D-xyloside xylohydrolase
MKFTDGYWHMRPGYTLHSPVQVYDVEVETDALRVYAPTRRISHRGDTVNAPLLTVRFSSPLANVVRVQICHHQGTPPQTPCFQLIELPAPRVEIRDSPAGAGLTSGDLNVWVEKAGDWLVAFRGGERALTQSGRGGMGIVDTPHGRFIHEGLGLGVGECVYGLGERFTPLVKNGQVVDMWNADGGTSSELAYKNIPFYLTNRGYGVFVNHPERVSFEVGSEKVERVQFSVPGEYLDYFLIYGPSPGEVLSRYTALTGRPALPPAWSFGLWLSTSFTTDYDEETVTRFVQGMADRDIPLSVFHFDCFWMKAFHWSDFAWDERIFPDPRGMLARLKARGLKVCVWINPYIAQRSPLFDEGAERGYLLKRLDGSVWQCDSWQAGMGIVDFTNPEARRWYAGKLRALIDMGVDCFKTDFGERIPTDVVYWDSSDPVKMHNYYPYLYNRTVFELLQEERGEGEVVLFARSATAGGQRFPVHWGGDCTATFESMAESLRGGLSLSLSGFGFWSHDIGGFEHTPSPAVYQRWCAFGLLSSHSRLHGNSSYRVPWLIDDESVQVLRFFTRLKCGLMPYLFGTAFEAHRTGVPMMRAMMLEFPDDPACEYLDRQYMLGESLLVAPVFSEDGSVSYYLPHGRWTSLLTGEVLMGPRWVRERHGAMSIPLLVRPNSVIPVGGRDDRPDYDYGEGLTLQVYELAEGEPVNVMVPTVTGSPGSEYTLRRTRDEIRVDRRGKSDPWQILLVGLESVESAEDCEVVITGKGIQIVPRPDLDQVIVRLTRRSPA